MSGSVSRCFARTLLASAKEIIGDLILRRTMVISSTMTAIASAILFKMATASQNDSAKTKEPRVWMPACLISLNAWPRRNMHTEHSNSEG